jgi:hypothetical protein
MRRERGAKRAAEIRAKVLGAPSAAHAPATASKPSRVAKMMRSMRDDIPRPKPKRRSPRKPSARPVLPADIEPGEQEAVERLTAWVAAGYRTKCRDWFGRWYRRGEGRLAIIAHAVVLAKAAPTIVADESGHERHEAFATLERGCQLVTDWVARWCRPDVPDYFQPPPGYDLVVELARILRGPAGEVLLAKPGPPASVKAQLVSDAGRPSYWTPAVAHLVAHGITERQRREIKTVFGL